MTNELDNIKGLYEDRRWKDIADIYLKMGFKARRTTEKNQEAVDIYLKALREIGEFDKANLLEKKSNRPLSSRVSFHDIFRLVFYKELYGDFDTKGLVKHTIHELKKINYTAWEDIIVLLANNSPVENFIEFKEKFCLTRKLDFNFNKIFISGYGRSGTGALRSFFHEFDEVYEVPGSEIQVIVGERGLWHIYSSKSKEDFRLRFLEFFVVHALGISALNHGQDAKEFVRANKIISHSDDFLFLQAFYNLYEKVYFSSVFTNALVERSCQEFLNELLLSLNKPNNKTVFLFNNVVNAENIRKMKLVDDYICFAVTRDPRSQYASFLSTQKPDWCVKSFLSHFNRFDEAFQKGLLTLGEKGKYIKVIRFEDVVFSESFRQEIVQLCGLDNKKSRRYTKLKPDESIENVFFA